VARLQLLARAADRGDRAARPPPPVGIARISVNSLPSSGILKNGA
jgi:hypothetical protein